jgi:hypothetical protein
VVDPLFTQDWESLLTPPRSTQPGVLDSSCNFAEHPGLIAQRIRRYAELIGRERVTALSDLRVRRGAGVDGAVGQGFGELILDPDAGGDAAELQHDPAAFGRDVVP